MVKIEKLDKYFNKGKANENHVLREVSLEFDSTGLVCILGESGSGKTTLLNTLGGLDTFRSGSITVDDTVLKKYEPKKVEGLRNQKFGYIFQNYYLLQDYTVAYNIKLALNVFDLTEEEKDARVDYVLEALGMSRYKKKRVSQLSGGQQQRVSIARALVKSPEIILADEPTGNLDEENTLKIMGILKSISKECLVVLVSHEKAIAHFFADRIIEIEDGAIKKDYENQAQTSYQKMDDSNIYLQEMQRLEMCSELADVSLYWDSARKPEKITLQLAWKDGKLFVQAKEDIPLVLAGEEVGCVMLDEKRPKLEQSRIEENISYDLPKLKAAGSAKLASGEIWKLALENIRMMGKKHKFIVGILLATSILMVLALADFMMQHAINEEAVVTEDSHYVSVTLDTTGKGTGQETGDKIREYCNTYLTGEYRDASLETTGVLNIYYDGFRQVKSASAKINEYSAVSVDKLLEKDLLYGRMPENRMEIVLDRWVIDTFRKSGSVVAELLPNEKAFLNVQMSSPIPDLKLTVVGICDTGEPAVYMNKNLMLGINYSSLYVMSDEDLKALDPDTYGDIDLTDNEMYVDSDKYELYESQLQWESGDQVTGEAEGKLGLGKLSVAGDFPMHVGAEYVLSQENIDRLRLNSIITARKFKVYTEDIEGTIAYFEKAGKDYENYFTVTAISTREEQLKAYQEERDKGLNAGYLVTAAAVFLALVMIYFTIKSNAMARSEELTVYRLIGIAPGSIIRVYVLEMLLITAYTCVPAILIASGVIKFITAIPSLQIYLLFPWWMALALMLLLFVVNAVISVLPVGSILRKPPALLAARE